MSAKQVRIKELESTIAKAQNAYYNGSEIITDDEYDALVYELSCLDNGNSALAKIGADPVDSWVKSKHLTPLGSLNKVNYPHEMEKWIAETLFNKEVVVVEKLDGLSLGLQYENGRLIKACLRGNAIEGEDILPNVLKMQGCVTNLHSFSGTVRGEILLKNSLLEKHFKEYSNPRNAASGICRRFDGKGCEHLTLMCYQIIGDDNFVTEEEQLKFLARNKFIVPNYKVCKSHKEVTKMWEEYQKSTRDALDYAIDGLVINCNNLEFQESLGATDLRPKGKKAFKFANQFIKSTVTKIDYQIGASGRATPICWFNKVNLLGSEIEKASVYNVAYVNELGLDVGAEVLVCKANEIIPRVEKVVKSTGTVAEPPVSCPECKTKLKTEGEYLICPNTLACPAQITGKIENWVSQLNILEWGVALIQRLIDAGKVKTIADLYRLSVDELTNIDRMGKKSAKKCHQILWDNVELPLETFLGSLSIPMIGAVVVKMVISAGYDTLESIQKLSILQLQEINGLGPVKAESFYNGLITNKLLIEELLSLGIKIKQKAKGKLTGITFVITGSFSMKRSEMEKLIEDNGGAVKSSVGKDTSFLICSDPNSGSSKIASAKKNGTKVIEEEEFKKIIAN
jgi:DNA ligase (NAD+)